MNPTRQSTAIAVNELHDVGDSRRQAVAIAKTLAFDETASGKVALIVTEFATNLVKHGGGGVIILRAIPYPDGLGLEIMSLDKGPGMDADLCLRDGYSTSGSPGTGLGAARRLAASLNIFSLPGKGTTLTATLYPKPLPATAMILDCGAVCLPIEGEQRCGDGWCVRHDDQRTRIMVSDGLGHGPLAAEVSDLAIETFLQRPDETPGQLIQSLSAALKPTRGAALAIADIDHLKNLVTFAGIGNIAGYILTGNKSRGMVSLNGIVGNQLRRVTEFTYPCAADDVVLLHSDGLSTHWRIEAYPGLAFKSANLIAGTLYRDFSRHRDDATVVAVRRS